MNSKALLVLFVACIIFSGMASSYTYLKYLTIENVSTNPASPFSYNSPFTINAQVRQYDENQGDTNTLIPNGSFETGNVNNFQLGTITTVGNCANSSTTVINETSPNGIYDLQQNVNASTADDRCFKFLSLSNVKVYNGDVICWYAKKTSGSASETVHFVLGNDANIGAGGSSTGQPFCPDGSGLTNCEITSATFVQKCLTISPPAGVPNAGFDGNSLKFGLYLRTTGGATTGYIDYITLNGKKLSNQITTDANCYSTVGLLSTITMSKTSDSFYSNNNALNYSATTNSGIACTKSAYTSDDYNSSIQTYRPVSDFLVFTPISNIASYSLGSVTIYPQNESENIIFKVDSNSAFSEDVNYIILNALNDGKRYSIYTASAADYSAGIWNFNNTLTFGSTAYNGVQKIWNSNLGKFQHSFIDSLNLHETKYYLLKYQSPFKNWNTLNPNSQTDWDVSLLPSQFAQGSHSKDFFAISTYNNMRNQYRTKLPSITSNVSGSTFELLFNIRSDSNSATINAGTASVGVGGAFTDSTSNISISSTETTIHVSTGADYPLMKVSSTTLKNLELSDYALVEKGFFTQPLTVKKANGDSIERILIDGTNALVIAEGTAFRVQSQLYNKNGNLSYLEAKVYYYASNDNNQVAYFKKDFTGVGVGEVYNLDWQVPGVIDLNGTQSRPLVILLRAVDSSNNYYEIQSSSYRLRQYPSGPGDIILTAALSNKQIGEHLSGRVILRITAPETLRGVKVYVLDPQQNEFNAGYVKTFWKDTDFTCAGFDCSFNFSLPEQVFNVEGLWRAFFSVLLTTQEENLYSSLTAKQFSFTVNYKSFETARILEVVERTDHTYRNDEQIPLALQIRDQDLANLKNSLQVVLQVANCLGDATGGTCTVQDFNFSPDSFLYDAKTGYNYYFWRQVFINSDASLLADTDYYRIQAVVNDSLGKHGAIIVPLLAHRCQTYDLPSFWANGFNWLDTILGGCTSYTDNIVSLAVPTHEARILIDSTKSVTAPTQECFACLNVDNNNNYVDNLQQDLLCASWYTFNEASIDKFDFTLGNANSDYSKTGDNAQYVKFSVPFALVAYNDLTLMRQSMAREYTTEATTVGQLLGQGLNYLFVGVANPVADVFEGLTASGIISNVGFDCNFSRPLDPTYISGMLFYRIKGIQVINKTDMVVSHPELSDVAPADLVEYMQYKGLAVPDAKTSIEVYASDMTKILNTTVDSKIVIDVPYSQTKFKKTNIDANTQISNFSSLPSRLNFTAISDLFYSQETLVIRRYVPFTITAIIQPANIDFFTGIGQAWTELTANPGKFLVKNWFVELMLALFILFVVVVAAKARQAFGSQGNSGG